MTFVLRKQLQIMQLYCNSLTEYSRLLTKEVNIGDLLLGNGHPIRIQTMTTTDTMNTAATVAQTIRCIEAGAELVRITAPSIREAENLRNIKNELRSRGYAIPLIADIHFTPNAAEVAARIIEKVRVNPGNYVDKKKFEQIEYTDAEYVEEIERIRDRFTPLVKICKEYGTAMRIGTNHGSLSDRIMSRYGDTPMGMVESAMEFLRIARGENYHNIILSMKSSNPQVMVQAYRLLINKMFEEFQECYALHLGVTEAGDGEEGRIKSAAGIGSLLEDGIGDTIRVSLTEDPEFEIPVCRDIVKRYTAAKKISLIPSTIPPVEKLSYNPFEYTRRDTFEVSNIGSGHVPVVIADLSRFNPLKATDLTCAGYTYEAALDKWTISDTAADYIFIGHQVPDFPLPGTLKTVCYPAAWAMATDKSACFPIFDAGGFEEAEQRSEALNFVLMDCYSDQISINDYTWLDELANHPAVVLILSSSLNHSMAAVRRMCMILQEKNIKNPVILSINSDGKTADEHLIHFAAEAGALLLDGFGDGVFFGMTSSAYQIQYSGLKNAGGRNYANNTSVEQFINNTAFSILQASRTRISKTEYISCPSCGRTLFDLQETTSRIRNVTNHLKGIKIAIMGCIVNGPGEMADADFGYVGSGVGKITLYKGKEIMKRNIDSAIAVDALIELLKENEAWVEPNVLK